MKFEEWWKTIDSVERRIIGAATGKFVWDAAYKAAIESLRTEQKEKSDADHRE